MTKFVGVIAVNRRLNRLRAIAAGRDQRTLGVITPGSISGPEAKAAE